MFNNIGGKIKGLAKFICWMGIIISILSGGVICFGGVSTLANLQRYPYSFYGNTYNITAGILIAVTGSICAWLGSLVLYGFGQLVENSDIIRIDIQNRKTTSL